MKKSNLVMFLFLLLGISAQAQTGQVGDIAFANKLKTLLSHNVPEISVAHVQNTTDCVFLDAREKKEFEVSHIKNAVWVGYDDFNLERLKSVAKNKKIVVYCSVGYRSERITDKLIQAGYLHASNLYGGIFEWVNAGNAVVKSENTITNEVHTYNKSWSRWLRKGKKIY
jgi:rhodanese-related sulfurtransferase